MEVNSKKFWEDGYLILRNFLTETEFSRMRSDVFASLKQREKEGAAVTDALADPHLQHWVHDSRLIEAAKTILGEGELTYFGDGGYAVIGHGYEAGRDVGGWHRDNTDRSSLSAPDWNGRYTLIRFGFYLQDHSRSSGGLIVRRTSHNQILRGWKAHLYDRYLNTGIGDAGVWSMRIQHAGLGRCVRGFPSLALGPYLQGKLPGFLQSPFPVEERTGFWISYGLNDGHLKRHCDYLMTRAERVKMWERSFYEERILRECDAKGLSVIDMPQRMRDAIRRGEPVGQHVHHHQIAY